MVEPTFDDDLPELDEAAHKILNALSVNDPKFTALDMSNLYLKNSFLKSFGSMMKHNTHLKKLTLDACRLTDSGVRSIAMSLGTGGV